MNVNFSKSPRERISNTVSTTDSHRYLPPNEVPHTYRVITSEKNKYKESMTNAI